MNEGVPLLIFSFIGSPSDKGSINDQGIHIILLYQFCLTITWEGFLQIKTFLVFKASQIYVDN